MGHCSLGNSLLSLLPWHADLWFSSSLLPLSYVCSFLPPPECTVIWSQLCLKSWLWESVEARRAMGEPFQCLTSSWDPRPWWEKGQVQREPRPGARASASAGERPSDGNAWVERGGQRSAHAGPEMVPLTTPRRPWDVGSEPRTAGEQCRRGHT